MDDKKKSGRYQRMHTQLEALLKKSNDPIARMATVCAVLHHKMDYFFWTGFYLLKGGELIVGPYQGPVACQTLEAGKGVCWAAVTGEEAVVVPDVHLFPDHIACDSRSESEIVLPLYNSYGALVGVMDVDASEKNQFNDIDRSHLTEILKLIYLGLT